MKTILRNLFYTLKRFQTASMLNLMGLSAAFAAFVLLMMKVSYERDFDTCYPYTDRLVMLNLATSRGELCQYTSPRPNRLPYPTSTGHRIWHHLFPCLAETGFLYRPQESAILLRGALGRVSRLRKNHRTEVRGRQ